MRSMVEGAAAGRAPCTGLPPPPPFGRFPSPVSLRFTGEAR